MAIPGFVAAAMSALWSAAQKQYIEPAWGGLQGSQADATTLWNNVFWWLPSARVQSMGGQQEAVFTAPGGYTGGQALQPIYTTPASGLAPLVVSGRRKAQVVSRQQFISIFGRY
jgi:hypothetical protein